MNRKKLVRRTRLAAIIWQRWHIRRQLGGGVRSTWAVNGIYGVAGTYEDYLSGVAATGEMALQPADMATAPELHVAWKTDGQLHR